MQDLLNAETALYHMRTSFRTLCVQLEIQSELTAANFQLVGASATSKRFRSLSN